MKVCATLAIVAVAAFAGSAKEKEDDRGKAALGERASRSGHPNLFVFEPRIVPENAN